MIKNVEIKNVPTELIVNNESNTNYAVILINFTNVSETDKSFSLYVVQKGKQYPIFDDEGNLIEGDISTIFLYKRVLSTGNSLLLNFEKLLLSPQDGIYAICHEDNNSIVATISYEVY